MRLTIIQSPLYVSPLCTIGSISMFLFVWQLSPTEPKISVRCLVLSSGLPLQFLCLNAGSMYWSDDQEGRSLKG
ncbi:hypothetical protein R3P38DRAFT_3016169 [Favolaschia claudopus]|uniref:NADH dehydrogenase subunit 4 n=1 Tax=Favolaschia claudopus TaxID=2862362 RepID=A0AAW0AIJ2_9AGAR